MPFSSVAFLYLFLPIVLIGFFALPRSGRNIWLLTASLLFYSWGEHWYVLVMVASIVFNYFAGLAIQRCPEPDRLRVLLGCGVAANVALLIFCKYANFFAGNLDVMLAACTLPVIDLQPIHLPIGISFFTFQAISYLVDIGRRDISAQANLVTYGMYKSFFPQLIAGPIVRYRDVATQVDDHLPSVSLFAQGVERFVIGLAKKALIADIVASEADVAFGLSGDALGCANAWWGLLCYALQIYFDFSGYSDMAIGLGLMFGFRFKENFNLPYAAVSIRDFWRRWHISLSSWFRDYVYIPLGGNRGSRSRVAVNLLIVFVLCGLWHGAQWTFLAWGLFHGAFIAAEHLGLESFLARIPQVFRHGYALSVVLMGWVLFRADSLGHAWTYAQALGSPLGGIAGGWAPPIDVVCAVVIGVLGAAGAGRWIVQSQLLLRHRPIYSSVHILALLGLMGASILVILGHGHSPFIYFRF